MPPALPGLLSFLLTVFCLQWWHAPSYPAWLWCSLILPGVLGMIGCRQATRARQILIGISIGSLLATLAVSRTAHVPHGSSIDSYATGGQVTLYGRIIRSPDRRPLRSIYVMEARTLTQSGMTQPVTGLVRITDGADYPRYAYGDFLIVTGALERPEPIQGFRYDRYLAREGIYAVMPWGRIQGAMRARSHHPVALLDALRERFEGHINRLLPEPHASLLAGLLTGSRRGMPEDLTAAFAATGLTHLIAISGSNVTMVLIAIGALLFWLPLRFRLLPSAAAVFCFALFTGAGAPVLRAAIMGTLGLLALHAGRMAQARLLALWSASVLLAWRPQLLWWDASFQLSFLALLGLIELTPILKPLFRRVPETLGLRETLVATTAAQIATAPWVALLFGRFSLIAPVANLLVAPLVPVIMLLGTVATAASVLRTELGTLVGFLCYLLLSWMLGVARVLATLPGASIPLRLTPASALLPYAVLAGIVLRFRPRKDACAAAVV